MAATIQYTSTEARTLENGAKVVPQQSALFIELPENEQVSDKNEILDLYERYLPQVYNGDILSELTTQLRQPDVDRMKFALYWQTASGQKVYAKPEKNGSRAVWGFFTWLE